MTPLEFTADLAASGLRFTIPSHVDFKTVEDCNAFWAAWAQSATDSVKQQAQAVMATSPMTVTMDGWDRNEVMSQEEFDARRSVNSGNLSAGAIVTTGLPPPEDPPIVTTTMKITPVGESGDLFGAKERR